MKKTTDTDNIEKLNAMYAENGFRDITLTTDDRSILAAAEPIADAVATLFGDHCEVLIHSLENLSCSVIKIRNGQVTGRSIGSPMTDLGIKILKNAEDSRNDVVGSYLTKHTDGKTLKSITALIRNGTKPIGMFCINMNLSAPVLDIVKHFIPSESDVQQQESPEHFVMSTEELIRKSLETAISQISSKRKISQQEKSKLIVSELYKQGIFDVRGAVDITAKELGVSRYTVYNYIREARI